MAIIRTAGSSRRRPSSRLSRSTRFAAFHKKYYTAGRARLYVAGVFDAAAMEAAIRQAFGKWESGASGDAAKVPQPGSTRFALLDRPSAPQSTLWLGLRVPSPSHKDWVPLAGHGRAPRRGVRVAHHLEHPRAEGLHLLARQHRFGASRPRLLGRDRRRHDQRHRRVAQGDLFRDPAAPERAAAGRRAPGHPEQPGGHLRGAERVAGRRHRTAGVRRPARPGRPVPLHLRQAGHGRDPRGGPAHRQRLPDARHHDVWSSSGTSRP